MSSTRQSTSGSSKNGQGVASKVAETLRNWEVACVFYCLGCALLGALLIRVGRIAVGGCLAKEKWVQPWVRVMVERTALLVQVHRAGTRRVRSMTAVTEALEVLEVTDAGDAGGICQKTKGAFEGVEIARSRNARHDRKRSSLPSKRPPQRPVALEYQPTPRPNRPWTTHGPLSPPHHLSWTSRRGGAARAGVPAVPLPLPAPQPPIPTHPARRLGRGHRCRPNQCCHPWPGHRPRTPPSSVTGATRSLVLSLSPPNLCHSIRPNRARTGQGLRGRHET
eukprot:418009-Rhodomonas_salina.2